MNPDLGAPRSKTVTWYDPMATAARAAGMTGLAFMRAIGSGEVASAPIAELMGIRGVSADPGTVTFAGTPDDSTYNPIGVVHGGWVCTLLDSVLGCAVHTTLDVGWGYTSIEVKVSFLRAVTRDSGELTAVGRVVKPGRRVAFAEGEVHDAEGRLVATGSSSLLVFPLPQG